MRTIGKKGGSAAEFAVILPVVVMLVFGIIEFGLILYDQAMITNASREGARRGIVFSDPRASDATITNTVNTYCGTHLVSFSDPSPTPTVTVTRAGNNPGDALTVRVTYPYTFLVLSNFADLLPAQLVLTAETVMRLE